MSEPAKKPKILFAITQSEFGGAQRFLYNLTTNLKAEYDVVVIVGVDGSDEFPNALQTAGVRVIRLPHLRRAIRPWTDLRGVWDFAKIFREEAPDIIFLTSSKAGVLGTAGAAIRSKKGQKFTLIYRINWAFNDPRPEWERNAYAAVERSLSKYRDIILQNDRHDLETAKQRGIRPRRGFKVIHNGIDPNGLSFLSREEARAQIRQKSGVDLSAFDFVIGNNANFYKTKGLPYLLRAVAEVAKTVNVGCVIVGDGPDRVALEELILQLGLRGRVFLVGQWPKASQYLKAYDIFVFSSVKEGFPWAILEAMSAELPIVATRVGAIPEVIIEEQNGCIVLPGNADQLAKRILWLHQHREKWSEMGKLARARVFEKFTLDRMLQDYRSLFSLILQGQFEQIGFE